MNNWTNSFFATGGFVSYLTFENEEFTVKLSAPGDFGRHNSFNIKVNTESASEAIESAARTFYYNLCEQHSRAIRRYGADHSGIYKVLKAWYDMAHKED